MKPVMRNSLIIVTLSILGILPYFYFNWNNLNISEFITYLASFSTSIMVLVYLLTFTSQFEIMKRQLFEMEYSREIGSKPFPFVTIENVKIARPKFHVNPFDGALSFLSQIHCRFNLQNISNDPAASVNVIGHLCYLDEGKIMRTEESYLTSVPYLTKDNRIMSLYLGFYDEYRDFINGAFNHPRTPIIIFEIYFKNSLGGCFKSEVKYRNLGADWEEPLKEYLKLIKTYEIDYKENIIEFHKLQEKEEFKKMYDELEKVDEDIKTRNLPDEIELDFNIVYNTFNMCTITKDEYEKILSSKKYFLDYMRIELNEIEKSKNWSTRVKTWKIKE